MSVTDGMLVEASELGRRAGLYAPPTRWDVDLRSSMGSLSRHIEDAKDVPYYAQYLERLDSLVTSRVDHLAITAMHHIVSGQTDPNAVSCEQEMLARKAYDTRSLPDLRAWARVLLEPERVKRDLEVPTHTAFWAAWYGIFRYFLSKELEYSDGR